MILTEESDINRKAVIDGEGSGSGRAVTKTHQSVKINIALVRVLALPSIPIKKFFILMLMG